VEKDVFVFELIELGSGVFDEIRDTKQKSFLQCDSMGLTDEVVAEQTLKSKH
jgi:hypothetical protein